MSAPTPSPDLLDLKMMPSWVTEPAQANDYSNHPGEDERSFDREGRRPPRGRDQRTSRPPGREQRDGRKRPDNRRDERGGGERRPDNRPPREREPMAPLPQVGVRFLPRGAAFESVIAQIKSGTVAYSVFALARLFLDKPERYDVRLTAAEGATLHQLGENGPVSTDPRTLEASAFPAMKDRFYDEEQTQTEPIKGNFTNVARCRASGTLLGPTNHHSYQPQLRSLYEQRFSRRMSFQDYQRQIEVVSDPAVVEQWKEQARSITTYREKIAQGDEAQAPEGVATEGAESENEEAEGAQPKATETADAGAMESAEAPASEAAEAGASESAASEATVPEAVTAEDANAETAESDEAVAAESAEVSPTKSAATGPSFSSIAEAERHFRQTHLPTLLRSAPEFTVGGVESRRLQDRGLGRVIEDAWVAETRSPSKMMQELASGLRESGLNIFRHRRGMLFVSPIRIRSFGHERSSVSGSINTILEKLLESPGMNRKQLLEKMTPEGADAAVAERAKAMLVPDLRWLIAEGYVMEFNDGTLDLPRAKAPAPVQRGKVHQPVAVEAPLPESTPRVEMGEGSLSEGHAAAEEGGMSVEQSIQPIDSDAAVNDEGPVAHVASPETQQRGEPATDDEPTPGEEEPAAGEPAQQGATPLSDEEVPSPS